jgi:hypothetical protein
VSLYEEYCSYISAGSAAPIGGIAAATAPISTTSTTATPGQTSSTSTPTAIAGTVGGGGLSLGAKVGIGVGVPLAVLAIVAGLVALKFGWFSNKPAGPAYDAVAPGTGPSMAAASYASPPSHNPYTPYNQQTATYNDPHASYAPQNPVWANQPPVDQNQAWGAQTAYSQGYAGQEVAPVNHPYSNQSYAGSGVAVSGIGATAYSDSPAGSQAHPAGSPTPSSNHQIQHQSVYGSVLSPNSIGTSSPQTDATYPSGAPLISQQQQHELGTSEYRLSYNAGPLGYDVYETEEPHSAQHRS